MGGFEAWYRREHSRLAWPGRPGLVVTVTGTALGVDDVRRVAAGLREQSIDEVLARASVRTVTAARGHLMAWPTS